MRGRNIIGSIDGNAQSQLSQFMQGRRNSRPHHGHATTRGLSQDQRRNSMERWEVYYRKKR